jgi:hypothetical protein
VGLLQFNLLTRTPETAGLLSIFAMVLGAFISTLICAFIVSKLRLAHRLPEKMPMRGTIIELATAIEAYSNSPLAALKAFGLSILNHCIAFFSIYCAARAFTDKLSLFDIFTVFPLIITLASLPISVAGIGVREKLSEEMLHALYQIPSELAVLISISSFLMMVVWYLAGGVVYLLYRSPDGGHARLSDIREEVGGIEDRIEHSK